MNQFNSLSRKLYLSFLSIILILPLSSQTVSVGSGSYTTTFPGVDAANRNGYPSGTPYTNGNAANKPVPTNDWWSAKVKNAHADNLFNYPFTMKTKNSGLVTTYIPWGVIDNIEPVVVGVAGLNASVANVSDFSDWTIQMDWQNSNHHFTATTGIGMPFIYFTKDSSDLAQITVNQGTVSVSNEKLIISNLRNGADFVVYAPMGSTWLQSGNNYTSTLNGKNYWSMVFIPLTASNVSATATAYQKHAYVFPTNTRVNWQYNASTSEVTTDFIVETDVKEGTDTTMLIGLLPHQWANLSTASPQPLGQTYRTVRGDLKTLDGNRFSVTNTFHGILPTLPFQSPYSNGFNPGKQDDKIKAIQNDQLNPWTDSYNEGQMMNRLIQTARIADFMGDTTALNTMLTTVKNRLEDWLGYQGGEKAFLFYYNQNWTTMIGYPAGHGQDNNINDHHFHWGYFIHAASFVEQFQPGWSAQWGGMIDLLVRDAASSNRNDSLFPFLRNFSPYAGHCWANGFASFPQGNDQESTSESMQFNSSLIHWGSITNNTAIRDLGIYLYTTEQTAIEEYWFDKYNRNFAPSQQYSLVSRVWGNSYDNGTFWTSDIAASYGIELYPIHGGSMYLGHDTNYVSQLWSEIETNTGILSNQANPNLWHDIYWEYLAFLNPAKAIQLYDSYPDRDLKFGVSDAQTYHWLHAMNALGTIDVTVTASHPLAVVFNKNGDKTYVAHNYGSTPLIVSFSDSYSLSVPPKSTATSKDIAVDGLLSSDFNAVYPGGSIPLRLNISRGAASKVEFYRGDSLIASDTSAPFTITAANIPAGKHRFYARIYQGTNFKLSNILTIISGKQLPYSGNPIAIPGTIEAANYDIFEGGSASGISYQDNDQSNNGNFRTTEGVDASIDANEGNVVGWINGGEWLEYTINVQTAGFYNLNCRYASGNSSGGGPMHIIVGEDTIRSIPSFASTNSWTTWGNRFVNFIPLKSGEQVLRVAFENGEFNLGRMSFTYSASLPYSQPIADAGVNQLIQLPLDTALIDGSASVDPNNGSLSYQWTQVYGPSVLSFSNDTAMLSSISGLIEGVYLVRLKVDNGVASDEDDVYIISSNSANIAPTVSIYSPLDQSIYLQSDTVKIGVSASDLNGSILKVDFYAGNTLIGTDNQAPYEYKWFASASGVYTLIAIAMDNDSASTTSAPINLRVDPAPPCRDTSSNSEFFYEFSPAKNNPTLTFIPTLSGMGSPTCILYYGTSVSGPLPGYNVTPNVPFQINAAQGTTIYFYYTYTYPGQGQHDNSANKDSYKVGTCSIATDIIKLADESALRYFPNPVNDILTIEWTEGRHNIQVFDYSGKLVDELQFNGKVLQYDMSHFQSGMYFITIQNSETSTSFKVIR